MNLTPTIELALLRAWGFHFWDPNCIADQVGQEAAYDRYLLGAFGRLRAGQAVEEVITYLIRVELEDLGRRGGSGAQFRAGALARHLADYAAELPEGPIRVNSVDVVPTAQI